MFSGSLLSGVEQHLVPSLVKYCQHCFSGIYLPSHDTLHHIRTWRLATRLMASMEASYQKQTVENLALACLLHDTGMSETLDKTHGPAGERLAMEYLRAEGLDQDYFTEALLAIRLHDDKEYHKTGQEENIDPHSVLQLLSLADDMDAMGAVGVFRYYEIYLLRGIILSAIPGKVLDNLDIRYSRLKRILQDLPGWPDGLRRGYDKIYGFYRDMEDLSYTDPNHKKDNGPLEVIRIFEQKIRSPRLSLINCKPTVNQATMGKYARHFFDDFFLELDQTILS